MRWKSWTVLDAKNRFSEFLKASLEEGPQLVTRRGDATAVLVPIEQWQALKNEGRPNLKERLLAAEPRVEDLVPPRI